MKNVLNQAIKLFLALAVTLSFTACGNNAKPEEPENPVPETADTEKTNRRRKQRPPRRKYWSFISLRPGQPKA